MQHYIARAEEPARFAVKVCLFAGLFLVGSLAVARSDFFYWAQLSYVLGISAVILSLTYSDVIANLWEYYKYSQGWKFNRFSLYRKYFASVGKPIPDDMRGAGLLWIVRFFPRVIPFHSALYVVYLVVVTLVVAGDSNGLYDVCALVAVVVLSASAVLLGEITRGAQIGRSYYPGFAGILLLIGYAAFRIDQSLPSQARLVFWLVSVTVVLASAGWNMWVFVDDVWPARMAPAWLARTLNTFGIREFYTYDTPYNNAFVKVLPAAVLGQYKIHYVNTVKEVKEGYVVVPGTSSKALNMESERWAIEHGDFDVDPQLNHLIESRMIGQYAVASFKTFGASRFWGHESEVVSYRDLILGEIGDGDLFRGRAWILDARKLQRDGSCAHGAGEVAA